MSRNRNVRGLLGRALFDNFWLKAISVMCALGFYGFIHSAQHAQRTLKVALVAAMPPPEAARFMITELPAEVDVTIAGPKQIIEGLRGADLGPIPVDLSEGLDATKVKLSPRSLTGMPPAVRATKVAPNALTIRFEDEIPRQLAVRVKTKGTPARGMEIEGDVTVKPARVVVTGARSAVEVLQVIQADDFDVTGLGPGGHERKLALDVPANGVSLGQNHVTATLQIRAERLTKVFENVRVEVVGLKRANVRPSTITVTVEGPPTQVRELKEDQLIAYVRPKTGTEELPLKGKELFEVKLLLDGLRTKLKPNQVVVSW